MRPAGDGAAGRRPRGTSTRARYFHPSAVGAPTALGREYRAARWNYRVVYSGLGIALRGAEHRLDAAYIVLRAVIGLALATASTAVVAEQRRRLGGVHGQLEYLQALRDGQVPADAGRDGWLEQLDWQRRRVNRFSWLGVPLASLIAALGIVFVVSAPRAGAAGWVLVGLAGPLLVAGIAGAARMRTRIDRLRRQLGD